MAPEYALWGFLTYKADVYSFGVVALEVVSGKSNNNYMRNDNCVCLLDQVLYYFRFLFDPLHIFCKCFNYYLLIVKLLATFA